MYLSLIYPSLCQVWNVCCCPGQDSLLSSNGIRKTKDIGKEYIKPFVLPDKDVLQYISDIRLIILTIYSIYVVTIFFLHTWNIRINARPDYSMIDINGIKGEENDNKQLPVLALSLLASFFSHLGVGWA